MTQNSKHYRWDDCPSGCISWYSWSFLVDDFCNAFYLGASGDAGIPSPRNCNLFVNPSSSINIGGDTEICQGDSTTLTVSGGAGYHWITGDSTVSIIVSPSSPTTYSVAVTGSDGCSYEKSVLVDVHPIPVVSLELLKDTFCINETNIELTGGTPNGGSFSGDGIVSAMFEPASAGIGTHLITYTFQDVFGCTNSDSQEIIVEEGDCTLETKTIANESVKVIPNPSNGDFAIVPRNWIGPIIIQLYDTQGRKIYSDIGTESNQINVKNLNQGIYLLKVSNARYIATMRLIVQ